MRPILSFLLAVLLFIGGTSASAAQPVRWEDMEYVHYDASGFFADTETLSQLAAGSDAQAVTELYDRLYGQFAQIDAYNAVAYIHASADVTDEYWSAENQYAENLRYEMADALSTACYDVTCGPCAEPFAGKEKAVKENFDITSTGKVVENLDERMMVSGTDEGRRLQTQIDDLRDLLDAYRAGAILEDHGREGERV